MDYTTSTQMQPNYATSPNPNYPNYPNPQIQQNPNYETNPIAQNNEMQTNYETNPNALNPYFFQNYYYPQSMNPIDHHHLYHQQHHQHVAQYTVSHEYSYQQTVTGPVASSSTYYQNPVVGFMENEHVAVDHYAFNTNTLGVNLGTNQPHNRGIWKKAPKKTMVVQSAWCDICHIKCDTNDVLELHKQGKKHKKNLEKHIRAAATVPTTPSASFPLVPVTTGTLTSAGPISAPASSLLVANTASVVPMIGPQENPKKKKRPKSEPLENLETKKKKVLEGGAAAEAVRTCSVCNVVCNSDTVYSFHLSGQKHATMMKKHTLLTTVATAL